MVGSGNDGPAAKPSEETNDKGRAAAEPVKAAPVKLRHQVDGKDGSELGKILARRRALSKSCAPARSKEDPDDLSSIASLRNSTKKRRSEERNSPIPSSKSAESSPRDSTEEDAVPEPRKTRRLKKSCEPQDTSDESSSGKEAPEPRKTRRRKKSCEPQDTSDESSSGLEASKSRSKRKASLKPDDLELARARHSSSSSSSSSSKDHLSRSSRSGSKPHTSSRSSHASSKSGHSSGRKASLPVVSSRHTSSSSKGINRSQSSVSRSHHSSKKSEPSDSGDSGAKVSRSSSSTGNRMIKRSVAADNSSSKSASKTPSSKSTCKRTDREDIKHGDTKASKDTKHGDTGSSSHSSTSRSSSKSKRVDGEQKKGDDEHKSDKTSKVDSSSKPSSRGGSHKKPEDEKSDISRGSSKEEKGGSSKSSSRSSSKRVDELKSSTKGSRTSSSKKIEDADASQSASKSSSKSSSTSSSSKKPDSGADEKPKKTETKSSLKSSRQGDSETKSGKSQKLGLSMGASSFLPSLMGSSSSKKKAKAASKSSAPMVSAPSMVSNPTSVKSGAAADFWQKIKTDTDLMSLVSGKLEVSPLVKAASDGDLEALVALLDKGGDVNEKSKKGESLLQLAAGAGHVLAVRLLLDRGADLKLEDRYGLTALHAACMQKRTNVVQFLLHNGADVEGLTSTADTALCLAVKHNAEHVCNVLLNHGCEVNFIHSLDGQSLLHMACAMRHLRIARILIKRKVNPHLNSNSGDTAFKLLFQPSPPAMNGAERVLESTEQFLDWILLMATSKNDVSLLRALLRDCRDAIHLDYSVRCGNQSPLANAIKCGSVAVAVKLIEAGAPLRSEQALKDKVATRLLCSDDPDLLMAAVHAFMSDSATKKKTKILDLSGLGLELLSDELMGLLTARGKHASAYDQDTLEQLLSLEQLNLSNNNLSSLPSSLLHMPRLEKIRLEGNPLTAIPDHVIRAGATWVKVKEYLELLHKRATNWSQFKLLVTGQENVGKTTLLRALKSKKSKTTCKPNLATHGIATQEVTMSSASNANVGSTLLQPGQELTFNAWDMGGQSVYYPTHTLFLTLRSVYIVVFNVNTLMHDVSKGGGVEVGASDTGEARVSYWLQKIRNLSANSVDRKHAPVFLVGTHVDQLQASDTQTQEELLAELRTKLQLRYPRQRFPGLEDIALVSCKTGEGIQELKEKMIEVVRKRDLLPTANESLVRLCDYCRKYISILNEQTIAEREKETPDVKSIIGAGLGDGKAAAPVTKDALKFPDMISRAELERWALACGVAKGELSAAVNFLRDIGIILYFSLPRSTETGVVVDDLVVLNPQWLADVMSSLISFHHAWVKDGVLPVSAVSNVFGKFPPEMHDSLLTLLENFSIVYRIRSPLHTGSAGEYKEGILVPSMLPENCKDEALEESWPSAPPLTTKEFRRVYSFPFLPLGFFNRIMVRLLHLPGVVGTLFWQTGVVLHLEAKEGASPEAMLSFDPVSFQFSMHVRVAENCKEGRWQLLQSLVNCVETVLEELGLRDVAERVIPCTHCMTLHRSSSPAEGRAAEARVFMFTYTECADAIMEGKSFVFCNHICSPTRLVRLDDLAPDISLAGVALVQPESLKLGAVLGKGGFGTVYRGTLLPRPGSLAGPREVAVKEVVTSGKDAEVQQIFTDFQQEVFLMSELGSHPNLVNLIGVSLQPRPRMVLELLPGGDLYQLLHPNEPDEDALPVDGAEDVAISMIPEEEFPWTLRLRIALDIAKGMYGMHSHSPAILHRDLRSPNVFMVCRDVAAPVRAKVADFGLSRLVAPSMTGSLETWQWLAPEVQGVRPPSGSDAEAKHTKEEGYDTSSDVYSFAICCWELVSRGFPFQEYMQDPRFCRLNESTGLLYPDLHKLKAAIAHDGLRPSLPQQLAGEANASGEYDACPATFAGLIESCWHQDPSQRPTFREVVLLLSDILGEDGEANLIELDSNKSDPNEADDQARAAVDRLAVQAKKKRSRMSRQLHTPLVQKAPTSPPVQKLTPANVAYVEEFALERQVSLGKKAEVKCAALVMPVLLQSTDGVERKALELWAGCKDGSICILDASDLSLIHKWRAHEQAITCILVVKHHVWVASKGGYISIWDIQNTKQIYEKRIFNRFKRHVIRSMTLVRCADSSKLRVWLASPTSSTIHVYEPYVKGCQLVSLTQLPKKSLHISFVKHHESLVWVGASDHIMLYDPDSLECVGCWAGHQGSTVNDSALVAENEVWTSAASGQISCWQTSEGSVSTLRQLGDFTGTAMSLLQVVGAGTPNKRLWSSTGNRILIWSLGDKPKVLQELAGAHDAPVVSIVSIGEAIPFFRADEKVWTFGKDASVALWVRNDK